ncbi:MAG: hypothetical protein K6G28_04530, partial [Acholeplasmatales bacterium]|nr:hypothetical protein [Acholeplasmatales bacterium]
MYNTIIVGLTTIAGILGYNNYSYYEFNKSDLDCILDNTGIQLIQRENDYYFNNKKVKSSDLYTVEGENRYK